MNKNTKSTFLFYGFAFAAVLLLMVFFHFNAVHINTDWQRTTGVVTDIQEYHSASKHGSGWNHRIYVTYIANGNVCNSSDNFSGRDTGYYKIGDECEILYNPDNVTVCSIGEVNVNFNTYAPLFLAFPLLVGAIGVVLRNKKRL